MGKISQYFPVAAMAAFKRFIIHTFSQLFEIFVFMSLHILGQIFEKLSFLTKIAYTSEDHFFGSNIFQHTMVSISLPIHQVSPVLSSLYKLLSTICKTCCKHQPDSIYTISYRQNFTLTVDLFYVVFFWSSLTTDN
jgi:hypothetical protein